MPLFSFSRVRRFFTRRRDRGPDLKKQVEELKLCIQERDDEKEKLNRQIEDLKSKMKENERNTASMKLRLGFRIAELEEELEEADILKKESESSLSAQREHYVNMHREREAIRDQVERELYNMYNNVRKQLEESEHRCSRYEAVSHRVEADLDNECNHLREQLEESEHRREQQFRRYRDIIKLYIRESEKVYSLKECIKSLEDQLRCSINEQSKKV